MADQKRESEILIEDSPSKRAKLEEQKDESSSNNSSNNSSVTEIKSECFKLISIEADVAEDKGCRTTMEDVWVILPESEFSGKLRCAHFAIYDGHGGKLAAEFAKKNLNGNVLAAGLPRELMDIKAAKNSIREGFKRTDESILKESEKGNWQDGATAVCLWVLREFVIIANIGDAKAVLARNSISTSKEAEITLKAIVLTREHKAIFPEERSRIEKAGGSVGANGRIQGRLEVSRAFGDRHFKKVGVISTPDIQSFVLTERDQFIILGCDGLWGVFGPSEAVEFVQKQLKETSSASVAVRRLVKEAIRERRCKDNCTAILILFKHEI
ncbi:hypothetical protein LUZ60_013649 [Juncus effusus]|nr:hypothetical protein LUZ60_013649 [Juncus effusus]